MRNFATLDQVEFDESNGILRFFGQSTIGSLASLSLKREGSYVAVSAAYGPVEVAMRPRLQELTRVLARLRPVEGGLTPRQVGTGEAYISLGVLPDGMLLLRVTIVADASGNLNLNVALTDAMRAKLFEWLPVTPEG
jgi:hypothetical protein